MSKDKVKKVRMFGLRKKLTIIISSVGVFITAAAVLVGIQTYSNSITAQYNETAYLIAQTEEGFFEPGELKEMAQLAYDYNTGAATEEQRAETANSPRYAQLKELTRTLRRKMNANGVYVVVFNMDEIQRFDAAAKENGEWNPMYYIIDTYQQEDLEYSFADCAPMTEKYIPEVLESYRTGIHSDDYFIYQGDYGYNTVAVYPVFEGGETVAFINVEIPMTTLVSSIQSFIRSVVFSAAVVALILLSTSIGFLLRTMTKPIRLVSSEAAKFVGSNNEISNVLGTVKTRDEIQTLSESLLQMEVDINEYIDNLTKVTAEKERIGAELNVATQIQADMLPRIFPAFPDRKEFDIYASMTPAKEVGGDFYDFFLIDENHLGLVMADVSGKGVPAALFMVIAKTLIKNHAQLGEYSPAKVLMRANEQLCEGNEADLFVTVWLAILDIRTGKGLAANAGHEHPALRRADGSYELVVYRHSMAVAVMEGIPFKEHEFELHPGDSLFVYTDGVAEATNTKNELYGTDRMIEALNQNPDASPQEILTNVKKSVDEFVGDAPQFDDITMLCLHYNGPDQAAQ